MRPATRPRRGRGRPGRGHGEPERRRSAWSRPGSLGRPSRSRSTSPGGAGCRAPGGQSPPHPAAVSVCTDPPRPHHAPGPPPMSLPRRRPRWCCPRRARRSSRSQSRRPDVVDQAPLVLEELTREQVLDWRNRAAADHQLVFDHIDRYGEASVHRGIRRPAAAHVPSRSPGPRLHHLGAVMNRQMSGVVRPVVHCAPGLDDSIEAALAGFNSGRQSGRSDQSGDWNRCDADRCQCPRLPSAA